MAKPDDSYFINQLLLEYGSGGYEVAVKRAGLYRTNGSHILAEAWLDVAAAIRRRPPP